VALAVRHPFRAGPRRRAPWPYDAKLGGLGLLTGSEDKQASRLTSAKPEDQSGVQPTDYGDTARNPVFERVTPYTDLVLGMGMRVQQAIAGDNGYRYALNLDLSAGGLWLPGPAVSGLTPATVDATTGIQDFWETAGTLYALNGRYALSRTDDTAWPVSRDFGAGKAATDVVPFYPNGAAAEAAYVAMGTTEHIWRLTGGAWAQHATLTALAFRSAARQLYRATDVNTLGVVDENADPWTAANWSAANQFYVGDKRYSVAKLVATATGVLLALKTNGVYTLDPETGEDAELVPFLRQAPLSTNGAVYAEYLNDVYVAYGSSLFKIGQDLSFEDVGLERLMMHDGPVRGRVTAMCGDQFALYVAVYNDTDDTAYVLKYGAWAFDQRGVAQRIPAWHGSITPAYAGRITAMRKSTIGADSGRSRLYLGFASGAVKWFQLANTPNPAADPQYRFSTANGQLYIPTFHGGFRADDKALVAGSLTTLQMGSGSSVTAYYRTSPTSSWTAWPSAFSAPPHQTIDVEDGAYGAMVDVYLDVANGSASSPIEVVGFGLHTRLRTDLRQVFKLPVVCADGLRRADGVPFRRGASYLREQLRLFAEAKAPMEFVHPDGTTYHVAVVGYEQTDVWDRRSRALRSGVVLTLAEASRDQSYGTYARLEDRGTYAALEDLTYGQMEAA
jgi:hypothetical protein